MKMRLFFIMFLMFGLQNMAHAGTCSTLPTRIYNSCNLGYYYESGECISCAGLVQRQYDDNFANGTKWRDCPARAGTGAGGQHGSDYCAFPNSDCGDWQYTCDSGFTLDGTECVSDGGTTCDTITCSSDSTCTAAGYGECTDGCCTGTNSGGGTDCGDKPSGSSKAYCIGLGYSGWNSSTGCCTGAADSCASHTYCTSSSQCSSPYNACSSNCCKTISCTTCTSNSDCGSSQTCNQSTGCCMYSWGGGDSSSCTTTTCTSDSDCSSGGSGISLSKMCINGYCYNVGISSGVGGIGTGSGGTYNSLELCQNMASCDTGTSCQETLSGKYACLPDCGTGAYFVGATATCACQSCPDMENDAWDDNGWLVGTNAGGYGVGGITSCYIPAGTYYDEDGTFVFDADCPYTVDSGSGGGSGNGECETANDCPDSKMYRCTDGVCVLKIAG